MTASYVTVSSININFIWRCNMEKDSLVGRKYGDLSTQMQEEVRRMIVGSYFGMNNGVELKAPIKAGQYDITVDLDNGLSVAGTYIVSDEEIVVEINEDGVFYSRD